MPPTRPIVVLFGYDTSTFTLKIRLALKLKQIPYTFVAVPSMLPRPQLTESFNLTYRKIPVLAIGRELYCDTTIITEALENFFPASEGYPSLYPSTADGRNYRPMIRGFAAYWTDRPLFRVACGLMPASIWRSNFGKDRENLIGHAIDPEKLEKKLPENLSGLDQQLSMLEPLFQNNDNSPWIFSTSAPSLADISLFYELSWARDVASGSYTHSITAGGMSDGKLPGADPVFNAQRYPALYAWFRTAQGYFENLSSTETAGVDLDAVLAQMEESPMLGSRSLLLPTPRSAMVDLDAKSGLTEGALVSVTPDDTGRSNPTIGTLVALSPEEVVIKPTKLDPPAKIDVRIHFPRLGFVTRPHKEQKATTAAHL